MGTLIHEAEVTSHTEATPEQVWAIAGDVRRTGEWSHECKHVELLDGADAVVVGTRFRGGNVCGRSKWSRTNEVLEVDEGNEIVWRTVPTWLFRDSTIWRIRVEAAPEGGTTITQRYDVVKLSPVMERLLYLLVKAHRDRRPALTEDMQRLGEVAARSGAGTGVAARG
jgi:hypothetical protein